MDKHVCRKCKGTRFIRVGAKGKKQPCPYCGGKGKGYATKQ